MSDNDAIYNRLAKPAPSALKTIGAGRLRGKTDINPQWRYWALTNEFGPCGQGWKFSVDKLWTEKGNGNEVFCFAQVSLQINYTTEGQCVWSEPIPGLGGSKMVIQEKDGPYNNDECFKMAVTDALGTAAKMVGVAAAIYEGLWDGSKYRDEITPGSFGETAPPRRAPAKTQPAPTPPAPSSPAKSWEEMSSAERTRYVMASLKRAEAIEDPAGAIAEVERINAKVDSQQAEFSQTDLARIATEVNRVNFAKQAILTKGS